MLTVGARPETGQRSCGGSVAVETGSPVADAGSRHGGADKVDNAGDASGSRNDTDANNNGNSNGAINGGSSTSTTRGSAIVIAALAVNGIVDCAAYSVLAPFFGLQTEKVRCAFGRTVRYRPLAHVRSDGSHPAPFCGGNDSAALAHW